jgi:hypothetical protein
MHAMNSTNSSFYLTMAKNFRDLSRKYWNDKGPGAKWHVRHIRRRMRDYALAAVKEART